MQSAFGFKMLAFGPQVYGSKWTRGPVMVIVFYSTNGHSTNKDMAVSTFEEILLFEMLHVIMHAAAGSQWSPPMSAAACPQTHSHSSSSAHSCDRSPARPPLAPARSAHTCARAQAPHVRHV